MKQKYQDWIITALEFWDCEGKCKEHCAKMKEAFTELYLVRGHYIDPLSGKHEHWWLLDPDGYGIIDPTCMQFPSCGTGEYIEHIEGSQEPTGKCTNCGDYCYGSSCICSEKCREEAKKLCGYRFARK